MQAGSSDHDAQLMLLPLDESLVRQARTQVSGHGCELMEKLHALTGKPVRVLVRQLGLLLGWMVIDAQDMLQWRPLFDAVPLAKAINRQSLLMVDSAGVITGVVSDPFDLDDQTWLQAHSLEPVTFCLALATDIQAYLSVKEDSARAVDTLAVSDGETMRRGRGTQVLSFASVSEMASPAVKVVNSTLYDALKAGASDIHIESTAGGLTVKYRIDGVLDHATSANGVQLAEQILSRLKVLSELDIAERRIPQDGSFRVEAGGRDIDLRVSIMPSIHGEDAVIRILDKKEMVQSHGSLSLESLGFDGFSLAELRKLARAPYGMLLVTGPTGSGKTTTLYGALTEIHTGREKIITIEDPVEYQLPGILQIPVNERKGLTFAKGLRSILRHDPDKIMVGEIRDQETAEIAVQSALTGHLVLTTVHANNVFDVFGRFTHMGIDPYGFVSALNGIWAQRLIRVNCVNCSVVHHPTREDIAYLSGLQEPLDGFSFVKGAGCGDCRGTGFKKRRAIAEILVLNDEIREMVATKQPIRYVKEAARRNGTRSLHDAALALARSGETTLEEVRRVTAYV